MSLSLMTLRGLRDEGTFNWESETYSKGSFDFGEATSWPKMLN